MFQRRSDGSENFFRDWQAYEDGFGTIHGELWIGYILLICLETKKILIWELTIVIDILQLCYSERLSGENA